MAASQPFVKSLTVSASERGSMVKALLRQGVELLRHQMTQLRRRTTRLQQLEARFEEERLDLSRRLTQSEEMLQHLQTAWLSLIYASLSGLTFLAGVVLLVGEMMMGAIAIFFVSAIWFLILLRTLMQF
jgi:hypothetical protein